MNTKGGWWVWMEGCANCQVHNWKQPEDINKLQKCGKCKLIKYCSPECQAEHWEKVHKRQCIFIRDPAKSLGLRHKEDECVICQKVAQVGQNKIKEPGNPNYECIHKQVQEILPKVFHSHPWKITGESEDIREKAAIIMWQLVRKFELTQPYASIACREELGKWIQFLRASRFLFWIKRMIHPRPEASSIGLNNGNLEETINTIPDKLNRGGMTSGGITDPFHLWHTIMLVNEITYDLDLVMVLRFLKDPLSNLPDDIKKLVSECLTNADKYLKEAKKVLDALETQVTSYRDLIYILFGGNQGISCSFCSSMSLIKTKFSLTLLTFMTISCGRPDCHEKMIQMSSDCTKMRAAILTLWQEREFNSCDFCFQRLPVTLQNVKSKVHRCSNCLTVTYCSQDCFNQDREVHIKICKEDKDGRKKKLGVSARKEAARDRVDKLERLNAHLGHEEISQVFGKFKEKNEQTLKGGDKSHKSDKEQEKDGRKSHKFDEEEGEEEGKEDMCLKTNEDCSRVTLLENNLKKKGIYFQNENLQRKFMISAWYFNDEELSSLEKVESFSQLNKMCNGLFHKYRKVVSVAEDLGDRMPTDVEEMQKLTEALQVQSSKNKGRNKKDANKRKLRRKML